jgi:hypothetical protein
MSTQPVGAGGGSAAPQDFDAFAQEQLGGFTNTESGVVDSVETEPRGADGGAADAGEVVNNDTAGGTATAGKSVNGEAGAEEKDKVAATAEWSLDQAVLAKALADPVHGAIVKQLHDRLQESEKFREYFKTPEEAQSALALAPGGIEELKTHVERGKSAMAEQADFASGVPDRQKAALQGIAEEMPEQFVASLPLYLELVAQRNPEAYTRHMQGELRRSLEAEGLPGMLQALREAAAGDPEKPEVQKAFSDAWNALFAWGDKAGAVKAAAAAKDTKVEETPREKQLREENERYKTQEHQRTVSAWKEWEGPTNEAITKSLDKEIREKLERFFPPNTEKDFREFTMKARVAQILDELQTQMRADVALQGKLNDVIKDRAWQKNAEAVRTQVVNLQTARAMQLLPHAVKKVMAGAAEYAVQKAAEKTQRETAQAATADVTGHAGGHAPKPGQFSVKDVKAGGRLVGKTEEEILEM